MNLAKTSSLAATLFVALSSTTAFAGPNNVPLKASIATEETLRANPARCPGQPWLAGTTTGKGIASHLGLVTLSASDCVTPSPTTFSFTDGTLTLTAANGDTLKATYNGTLLPNSNGTSVFSIAGNFTVVGGTGRFKGASGSGYLEGDEDVLTGRGHFDITGSLSY